jgi:hypothetical protein
VGPPPLARRNPVDLPDRPLADHGTRRPRMTAASSLYGPTRLRRARSQVAPARARSTSASRSAL